MGLLNSFASVLGMTVGSYGVFFDWGWLSVWFLKETAEMEVMFVFRLKMDKKINSSFIN